MADNKRPKCPPQKDLPLPWLVWAGQFKHLGDSRPCRIVLEYKWHLFEGASAWEAVPEAVFERAERQDALNKNIYERRAMSDVPVVFFQDVVEAFSSVRPVATEEEK